MPRNYNPFRPPVTKPTRIRLPKWKKVKMLFRQHGLCKYCDAPIDLTNSHIDHFVPFWKDKTAGEDNLYACCILCNDIKKDNVFSTVLEFRVYIHVYKDLMSQSIWPDYNRVMLGVRKIMACLKQRFE